jgi:hypothetical protein
MSVVVDNFPEQQPPTSDFLLPKFESIFKQNPTPALFTAIFFYLSFRSLSNPLSILSLISLDCRLHWHGL